MENDLSRSEPQLRRLHEMEQAFAALAPEIKESPEKRAISLLHGMVQELWRNLRQSQPLVPGGGPTLQDVADLHQHAPKMEGPALNAPLPVGVPAPDFALPDAQGRIHRLSDFRGKPTVLAFYPLDWSPGCSRQLDLYQQELDEFIRRGVNLVGISVDSVYSHGAWATVRGITFPLLADFHPKGEVAKRYHVWREPDGFSERALYVLDDQGMIRHAHVSPQLHHVPDIYELFAVLDDVAKQKAA
ncbi:redoxin domain-containing protein [Roseomonas sp. NAR14]|uniref:Redoxin domain-containing protein n=1 Tax=Roseomonas acroporae TaxID=2937791 RepID=A0A9X1YD66_9PROT|nr:redoxin domain-containing protein [Roseomonas acroporae]MCK8786542.1 redoxin domain-containing protein [Roseomonas acroporae]